jgi:tetratricopeptide (TPR) repeat protein
MARSSARRLIGRSVLLAAIFLSAPLSAQQGSPTEPKKLPQPVQPEGKSPSDGKGQPEAKKRPFHSSLPDTPKKRAKLLQDLYAHLAAAEDAEEATKAAQAIERLWLSSGSDTVSVLMERAVSAANDKKYDLALKMLDTIVAVAPDYAEGFNRRAYVHYLNDDIGRAMADLRRTLALDPNHFKALDGLAQILKEIGDKKASFDVYKKLMEVHPFWQPAEQALRELSRDVEGQGI